MYKKIGIGSALILLLSTLLGAQNIDMLLGSLAQKDDLSVHTKKESAGYIIIFTRQDLDRMKVRSLKELIEKVPFMRYNEDSRGLSAPYYQPYQTNNPSRIRLYINDRELLSPLFGGGFQYMGQMDISYIDHIEIYMGLPSYEISIEPTVMVIKAYTKTGKRENTSLVGFSAGTYGTNDVYGYTSKDMGDYSYFVYANHRNLNRESLYHLGSELNRDKDTVDFYAQVTMPTSRLEFQAIKANMGNFLGSSWNMTPEDSGTDILYLYAGYNYTSLDKSFKASINYSYLEDTYCDSSETPLGLDQIPVAPFYYPYYSFKLKINEHLLDTKISKKFKIGKASLLLGVRNRYKKFTDVYRIKDGVETPLNSNYSSEDILSGYSEVDYLIDSQNRAIVSASVERYMENSDVRDETIYGARVGHIYHTDSFTQKSFLFYGKFRPTPYELQYNDSISPEPDRLNSEEAYVISTKSTYRYKNLTTSLLIARTYMDNSIYFDLQSYKNMENRFIFDSISWENTLMLNSVDKVVFNSWIVFDDYGKNSTDRHRFEYGGYISLFKKLGKLDTYNSLSCIGGVDDVPIGWNYNLTLTYQFSKSLTLYLKGENLFGDALKTDYYRIDPMSGQVTMLDDVSVFDRTIWFGLEYEF